MFDSSGAARGRTALMATLVALVLATLSPLESSAQGMPVFRDSTKAIREPHPGATNARDAVQIILVDPTTADRSLLPGDAATGVRVTLANPEQGWIYYYPSVIQNQKRPAGPLYNGSLATPDSTSPLIATGATRWVAWIYPTFDDSSAAVVFSFSVRHHPVQSSDSLTTFRFFKKRAMPWAVSTTTGTVGSQDTLGSLLERSQAVTYVDSLMRPHEFGPVVIHHSASPRGIGIEFHTSADFISIFARFLNTVTVSTASGFEGYNFCGKDPLTTWKWDLYGYRE